MTKETSGLKKYLTYINDRIMYLKMTGFGIPSNEYKFYNTLRERIKQWGDTHALCYAYIRGKIDMPQVQYAMGVSERVCYRMINNQQKDLIKFITLQEQILEEQYPHFKDGGQNE